MLTDPNVVGLAAGQKIITSDSSLPFVLVPGKLSDLKRALSPSDRESLETSLLANFNCRNRSEGVVPDLASSPLLVTPKDKGDPHELYMAFGNWTDFYPDAAVLARFSLPGYSDDGKSALVQVAVVEAPPSFPPGQYGLLLGENILVYLKLRGGQWHVVWAAEISRT